MERPPQWPSDVLRQVAIDDLLNRLPDHHRQALLWFAQSAGTEVSWPDPLPDGTFLATRAKGIYKPAWTEYALSVRTTLDSPYPDGERQPGPRGTWSMRYFQEGPDPQQRGQAYTNRGLLRCHEDEVPVGVLRQTSPSPDPRYKVEGLAVIAGWEEGFFLLEGIPSAEGVPTPAQMTELLAAQQDDAVDSGFFSPESLPDARERVAASIVRRRGQPEFRQKLLEAYDGRCAVTGCDVQEVLEACHIVPYRGPSTDHPGNGILLRADLHTLFDLGLIAFDSATGAVMVAARLKGTNYASLTRAKLTLPAAPALRPSREALEHHRASASL